MADEALAHWSFDSSRSILAFQTTFSGAPIRGKFVRWQADVLFDVQHLRTSHFNVDVELDSVLTDAVEVNTALLGTDWFDVARFPQARFVSSSFEDLGAGRFMVVGRLSLRGITKSLRVPFTLRTDPAGRRMQGELPIDRSDFGVGQGQWASATSVPLTVLVAFDLRETSVVGQQPAKLEGKPAADEGAWPTGWDSEWNTRPVDDYKPKPAFANQTHAPPPPRRSEVDVHVLADHLEHPWSLAFLPDGRMLVTERPGRVRLVEKSGQMSEPIEGVPTVKDVGTGGLHDVLLDLDFSTNRVIYLTYYAPLSSRDPPRTLQAWISWLLLPAGQHELHPYGVERVARARLSEDYQRLEDLQVIHEGGERRLVWATDGSLYITSAPPAGGGIPVDDEPQRLGNAYGKVLRIHRDGSIPSDNPFVGRPGSRPDIYAYGLRDMEGAAINPWTGELWCSENGPRGGDEINIIRPARNYGFPIIGYGREYSGQLINGGKTAQTGLEQPVYFWTPSIAPSGLTFYTGGLFPNWRGSLFSGALAGKRLIRLVLKGDRVVYEEDLLAERGKRIRDVRQGPEGALYVLTDEDDGELLTLTPKAPLR